jgi:ABC-type polysaccharide/polyol phosphate export permease
MFRHQSRRKTLIGTVFVCMELTFHLAVNQLRQSHGNAVLGLFMTIFKNVLMVGIMYFMFDLLGLRRVAVRGDFLLYVMSGVFMFMTHTAALGAVSKADGPTSPMMLHSPMYPLIAIGGSALASLYRQTLSAGVILFLYHTFFHHIYIEHPVDLMGMYLLSWASGLGIGMVFRAMRPWQPDLATLLTTVLMRANVVASGKMVLINNMSPKLRNWFDWNPLFHTIDQGRGALFLNYTPHFTSVSYPVYVTLGLFIIGLMAEFFTRQHVSLSWGKRG